MGQILILCLLFCGDGQSSNRYEEERTKYLQKVREYNELVQEREADELKISFCKDGVLKVRKPVARGVHYDAIVFVCKSWDDRSGSTVSCVGKAVK